MKFALLVFTLNEVEGMRWKSHCRLPPILYVRGSLEEQDEWVIALEPAAGYPRPMPPPNCTIVRDLALELIDAAR